MKLTDFEITALRFFLKKECKKLEILFKGEKRKLSQFNTLERVIAKLDEEKDRMSFCSCLYPDPDPNIDLTKMSCLECGKWMRPKRSIVVDRA